MILKSIHYQILELIYPDEKSFLFIFDTLKDYLLMDVNKAIDELIDNKMIKEKEVKCQSIFSITFSGGWRAYAGMR